MSENQKLLPYKDFTIKAKLRHAHEKENLLISINAQFIGIDFQTDHYFQTPKGKLKWREGTIENLITHYERFTVEGLEQTLVYRYDLHPTKEMIDELLRNHKSIGTIKKERKIYRLNNIKIHLDKLPNDEKFIEIEAIDSENRFTIEELRNQCLTIKEKLRIQEEEVVPTGYLMNP